MSRRAVILAGGRGARLQPYTVVLPKPLMPIGEYPILEVILRQLVNSGFEHITLAVNHQAELIKAFFQNGDRWGIRIDYSLEDQPLGTMAPLRLINDLPDDFLVMNGDILTNLDFAVFHDQHVQNGNAFTISSIKRHHQIDYGVLTTNDAGILIKFKEKPDVNYEVSMGVYMVNRTTLKLIPESQPYGFDDLMIDLLSHEKIAHVQPFDGYWLDIGRPDDYRTAVDIFEQEQKKFLGEENE